MFNGFVKLFQRAVIYDNCRAESFLLFNVELIGFANAKFLFVPISALGTLQTQAAVGIDTPDFVTATIPTGFEHQRDIQDSHRFALSMGSDQFGADEPASSRVNQAL